MASGGQQTSMDNIEWMDIKTEERRFSLEVPVRDDDVVGGH